MATTITAEPLGTIAHYLLRTTTDFARILIDPAHNLVMCYSSCGNYNYSWHSPGEDFTIFLNRLPFDYAMEKFLGSPKELDIKRSAKIMREHICQYRHDETYTAEAAREMWKAVADAEKYSNPEFAVQISDSAFARHLGPSQQWYDCVSYFHGHQADHFWNLFWRPLMQYLTAEPETMPAGSSRCMCVDTKGALLNWGKKQLACITDDNDEPMKPRAARAWLLDQLEQGRKVLPMGDCDNFDYTTGCRGHLAPADDEA